MTAKESFEHEILGKSLGEAMLLGDRRGFLVSLAMISGVSCIQPSDIDDNRLNVEIKNGKIIRVLNWG